MNSMGKKRWDSMVSNSSLGYTVHGGSVPNLLSPPRSEGLGTLKKRLSMEVLRGWAPDLGSLSMGLNLNLSPVKWPSLVTVCKWKQSLAEKLKKKHCGTEDQSQSIFSLTEPLFQVLQSKTMDIKKCQDRIMSTLSALKATRTDETFSRIYDETVKAVGDPVPRLGRPGAGV
ncbi:hypothetical protein JOQ06_019106 [Pogonophryne albipinna]|uniref:Uncharacterized protein n=1 Tax=Pogonophryne albipinna TaxID=1090488 RepID=A0AAD6ARR7_9TELE|nr:hypothetical protein JOQ06_019106 [Pogonophryne albipinna]